MAERIAERRHLEAAAAEHTIIEHPHKFENRASRQRGLAIG